MSESRNAQEVLGNGSSRERGGRGSGLGSFVKYQEKKKKLLEVNIEFKPHGLEG